MRRFQQIIVGAAFILSGCSSPTRPPVEVSEPINGDFQQLPWSHSRQYAADGFDELTVGVMFSGDYDDLLWIEIWRGPTLVSSAVAKGYFDPSKRLTVAMTPGQSYELRLRTDKCCTRYEGTVTRARTP